MVRAKVSSDALAPILHNLDFCDSYSDLCTYWSAASSAVVLRRQSGRSMHQQRVNFRGGAMCMCKQLFRQSKLLRWVTADSLGTRIEKKQPTINGTLHGYRSLPSCTDSWRADSGKLYGHRASAAAT